MNRKLLLFAAIGMLSLTVFFAGCASSGLLASGHVTSVELSKANYKIIATSVTGEASANYLFGASIGVGMYLQTVALIPLTRDRQLYKVAMQDLWRNFENTNGSPIGRKLALVNIRYDSEALNILVYTKPRVSIIADVVEFTE